MRWFYVAVPLLILLSVIAWRWQMKHAAAAQQALMMASRGKAPASVEVGTVQYRDLVTSFEATGSVESPQNIKISPKVTGIILTPPSDNPHYQLWHEGDYVHADDILAQIDPSEYKANVDQAKAAHEQAISHLKQATLTQNPNTVQVNTQIRQMEEGVNSAQANYDQANANYSAQKAAAEAAVNDAKNKVKSALVTVENAKQGIKSAEANKNSAVTAVENAQTAIDSANANRDSAQTAADNAQTAIGSAQANRDSAKTSIENAQALVESAKANLVDAKAKCERTTKLYEQGYETKQDVDDAQAATSVQSAAVDVALGQLKMANSALTVQEAAVNTAQGQLKMARSAQAAQDAAVATAKGQLKMARSALAVQDAAVATAQGQERAAEAALASAQQEEASAEEQSKIVVTSGAATIKDTEAALNQVVEARKYAKSNSAQIDAYVQNLAALQAAVDAAQAQLDLTQTQLAETVLRAPFDGYITTLFMDPGSMASPNQPIFALQSINAVWVTIAVPEDVFTKVKDGQSASVQFDSFPNQTFEAKIVQLNPAADPLGRQFTLRAVLKNLDKQFKPGMFARVSVVTQRVEHVLTVPREAVNHDEKGAFVMTVMTVGKDSIANRCAVTTGPSDVAYIQVNCIQLGEALVPGDKVITMSASPVKDGKKVTTGRPQGQHGGAPGKGGADKPAGTPGGDPGQTAPATPGAQPGAPARSPAPLSTPQSTGDGGSLPPTGASPSPSAGTGSPMHNAPGGLRPHRQAGAQASGG